MLWSDFLGSPFYVLLTKNIVTSYVDRHYRGVLEYTGCGYSSGEYYAIVTDSEKSKYKMTYDIEKDIVGDGYYYSSYIVMKHLIRAKIREVISVNTGIELDLDEIMIELDVPKYVYSVGDMPSGYDSIISVRITMKSFFSEKNEFARDSYAILCALKQSGAGIENVDISSVDYEICINDNGFPTDILSAESLVFSK